MHKTISQRARAIFDGMATICDCDTTGDKHAPECEITHAWADAYEAAEAQECAAWDGAYGLDDDPTYGPFHGDDLDALDDFAGDDGDDW